MTYPAKSPALRRSLARRDICPECGGALDTGWECNACGYDAQDEAYPPAMRAIERKYGEGPL
jgi:tRNA(Ile2) C34 agmatinyltransferase TiaS